MVKFDSNRYWKATTWDRYSELNKVPEIVRKEFTHQEKLFITCIQEIACDKSLTILDLACGTGKIAEEIKKINPEGFSLVLADFNENTLNLAKKNLKNYKGIDYVVLDAYKVGDILQNCFDIIVCVDFLHHVSKPNILIEQIHRSLKPGGCFIANAFNQDLYNEWDKNKYGTIHSLKRRFSFFVSTKTYNYLPHKVREHIDKAGLARISPLREEEIHTILSPLFSIKKIDKGYYIWFCAQKK